MEDSEVAARVKIEPTRLAEGDFESVVDSVCTGKCGEFQRRLK